MKTFDEILRLRRSIREFTDEVPPKDLIEKIIDAGYLAPYAAQAVGSDKRFRKFYKHRLQRILSFLIDFFHSN